MELRDQRNSNIELLRIIAMLLIVAHHYVLDGLPAEYLLNGPNKWLTEFLFGYGKTGVNIFVLITGYYMVNMDFSIKRPLKIIGQVWFYSLLMLLIRLMIPAISAQMGRYEILRALFPIRFSEYWFATQYVLLLVVSPFLNRFAHSIGKKHLTVCVIILVVFNSVMPCIRAMLTGELYFQLDAQPEWFAMLYLMAARIRLYSPSSAERKELRRHTLSAIIWGISITAWAWLRQILFAVTGNERFHEFMTLTQMDWSFFGVMFALELFQCFRLMKPRFCKWINLLASFSFGVYLFHTQISFFSVKAAVFGQPEPASALALILYASAVVFGIYIAGSAVDLIRQKTVGWLWDGAVNKISPSLERVGCAVYKKAAALIDSPQMTHPSSADQSDKLGLPQIKAEKKMLTGSENQRNSNIGLLCIIAMLMIVAHNCALYGFYPEDIQYSRNKWIVDFLFSYGNVGVSIFVLISGYYMTEQNFSLERVLRFAGQVWFYSLCALAAALLISGTGLGKENIIEAIFPLSNSHYWFASTFLLLMLIAPAINVFVHNASCMFLQNTAAVLMSACLILPTLFNSDSIFSHLCWFILLYITGSYIRLWRQDAGRPEKHFLRAILWALTIPMYAWGGNILWKLTGHIELSCFYSPLNREWSITGYIAAIEFFEWARSRQPEHRPWINRVAMLVFGVYLFHDAPLVRGLWWQLGGLPDKINSRALPLWVGMAILATYLVGSVIDLVRQKTVGHLWDRAVSKLSPKLERWGCAAYQKFAAAIDRQA